MRYTLFIAKDLGINSMFHRIGNDRGTRAGQLYIVERIDHIEPGFVIEYGISNDPFMGAVRTAFGVVVSWSEWGVQIHSGVTVNRANGKAVTSRIGGVRTIRWSEVINVCGWVRSDIEFMAAA